MTKVKHILTMEEVHEWFYEKDSVLHWKKTRRNGAVKAGTPIKKIKNGYYAMRFKDTWFFTHRILFAIYNGYYPTLYVDHINGDVFDNRKENLREVTNQQSNYNKGKIKKKTSSKYKGVSKTKWGWRASIRKDKKGIWLGVFKDEESAARAYDEAALIYHGEFARLNFPRSAA